MVFARYLSVGGVATLTHYLFLLLTVERHWLLPPVAAGVGALCGAGVAYVGNRHFTFQSARHHRVAAPRFLLVALLGAGLSSMLVALGSTLLGWHYLLAQLIATGIAMGLTFHLNRRWTFA